MGGSKFPEHSYIGGHLLHFKHPGAFKPQSPLPSIHSLHPNSPPHAARVHLQNLLTYLHKGSVKQALTWGFGPIIKISLDLDLCPHIN